MIALDAQVAERAVDLRSRTSSASKQDAAVAPQAAAAPTGSAHVSGLAHALFDAAFAPSATSEPLLKAPDAFGAHTSLAAFAEPVHR